jgi:hypothetical protein
MNCSEFWLIISASTFTLPQEDERQLEDLIPKHVPIKIKIKKENEAVERAAERQPHSNFLLLQPCHNLLILRIVTNRIECFISRDHVSIGEAFLDRRAERLQ